jgi:hypothetical protein
MANTFPVFAEFAKGPVTQSEARRLLGGAQKELTELGDWAIAIENMGFQTPPTGFQDYLPWELYVLWEAPTERRWLKDHGVADVDRMVPIQAVFLAAWNKYQAAHNTVSTALLLPPAQGAVELRRAINDAQNLRAERPGDRILRVLLPSTFGLERVFRSSIRLRRQLAALRAIEAIRAHLATGRGLPKAWSEVTAVPVPDDPLTGKPFDYRLDNGRAVIAAPPPAGEQPNRSNNFRYELTVRPVK